MKQIRKDRKRRREVDEARSKERRRKSGQMDERRVRVAVNTSCLRSGVKNTLATTTTTLNVRQKKVELIERSDRVSSSATAERPESVWAIDAVNSSVLQGKHSTKVTKVRNRCVDTGRGRSVIRWFRRSGRAVRERGRKGRLEGVYRVSW